MCVSVTRAPGVMLCAGFLCYCTICNILCSSGDPVTPMLAGHLVLVHVPIFKIIILKGSTGLHFVLCAHLLAALLCNLSLLVH